eukprot:6174480-Pleurochrysis_carterae.AAC.6
MSDSPAITIRKQFVGVLRGRHSCATGSSQSTGKRGGDEPCGRATADARASPVPSMWLLPSHATPPFRVLKNQAHGVQTVCDIYSRFSSFSLPGSSYYSNVQEASDIASTCKKSACSSNVVDTAGLGSI